MTKLSKKWAIPFIVLGVLLVVAPIILTISYADTIWVAALMGLGWFDFIVLATAFIALLIVGMWLIRYGRRLNKHD